MSADKETKKAKPAKETKAEPVKKVKEPKGAAAGGSAKQGKPSRPIAPARLSTFYKDIVAKELTEKFGYSTPMQVPRIDKIVLNMGVGEAVADKKIMDYAVGDMTKIAGQKPLVTKSRKAIANFKIREDYPVGCKVTLRGARMYEFLDRLVNIALPRVRDFRGLRPKSFDGRGNFALGLKEQIIFPEIDYDKVDKVRGMDIIICTTAKTDDEALALLKGFDMPFMN